MTAEGAAQIETDLGWALGVVFRGYLKAAGSAVADLPGGPRGFQVLTAAAANRGGSQVALAQQLGVDRTVMTYLLDDLARAGLLERKADPADRRARHIVVTASGHERLAQLRQGLLAAEANVLSALDPADRDTFRALLQQLAGEAAIISPGLGTCSPVNPPSGAAGC
jgi:DNA-binding MarR family transcriptional regulator